MILTKKIMAYKEYNRNMITQEENDDYCISLGTIENAQEEMNEGERVTKVTYLEKRLEDTGFYSYIFEVEYKDRDVTINEILK